MESHGERSSLARLDQNDLDTDIKKELIAQYKLIIANQPDSPEAVTALRHLYSFVRRDKTDKLGEKSGIMDYLNNLYTTQENLQLGKTALQLMIIENRRNEDLVAAISLSETARSLLAGDAKSGVLFNLVFMYLQTEELSKAKEVVAAYKSEFPKEKAEIEFLEDSLEKAFSRSAQLAETSEGSSKASPETQSLAQEITVPEEFRLFPNYPNPFNPETRVRYQIPGAGFVQLKIFNLIGQEIRTLEEAQKSAGVYSVVWDGKDSLGRPVSSGIYIYQLTVDPTSENGQRFTDSRKLALVR